MSVYLEIGLGREVAVLVEVIFGMKGGEGY